MHIKDSLYSHTISKQQTNKKIQIQRIQTMSTIFPKQLMLHTTEHPQSLDRHTIAVNLARRYTVQNENDLMQVRAHVPCR